MLSTIHYKQGDVVLIPFPFTDFSTFKQRPALIISSDTYNSEHQDVIVCAITSHIPKEPEAADLLLTDDDLHDGGLPIKTAQEAIKLLERILH